MFKMCSNSYSCQLLSPRHDHLQVHTILRVSLFHDITTTVQRFIILLLLSLLLLCTIYKGPRRIVAVHSSCYWSIMGLGIRTWTSATHNIPSARKHERETTLTSTRGHTRFENFKVTRFPFSIILYKRKYIVHIEYAVSR